MHVQDASEDLSPFIAKYVDRRPGDQVRCVRVFGARYRCNWWSTADGDDYDNPSMPGGQIGTAHTIRKSQFLEVTRDVTPDRRVGLRIIVLGTSEGVGDVREPDNSAHKGAGAGPESR